jgi:hypothetical protein
MLVVREELAALTAAVAAVGVDSLVDSTTLVLAAMAEREPVAVAAVPHPLRIAVSVAEAAELFLNP